MRGRHIHGITFQLGPLGLSFAYHRNGAIAMAVGLRRHLNHANATRDHSRNPPASSRSRGRASDVA